MKRLCFYISICVLPAATPVAAQTMSIAKVNPAIYAKPGTGITGNPCYYFLNNFAGNTTLKPVQSDLYTQHLGFFCKQELKLEQQVKMPVKIRLGSTEYTNWLEQKAGCEMPTR